MKAVVVLGGKQYSVQEGDVLFVEKQDQEDKFTVDQVLAINDGANSVFGKPYVEGAKVVFEVEKHGKQKKIIVFKYKAKKGYRRKQGHRQPYTRLKVLEVSKA